MAPALSIESIPGHADFRALHGLRGIRHELRYASTNNFVGVDMYSPFDCAWLHREAAHALESAACALSARDPALSLLILDALRPQRVQERMWKKLEGTGLTSYLANPVRGSIHSFGMAVDVTIVDAAGRELDMGTPFDDLTERSHPAREKQMLARGELRGEHLHNRKLLRDAMLATGWHGINSEWWHFDCGHRERVRAQYQRVL